MQPRLGEWVAEQCKSYHGKLGCSWSFKQSYWKGLSYFSEFPCLFLRKQICGCCQGSTFVDSLLPNVIWIWSIQPPPEVKCMLLMHCWNLNKLFKEKFVYLSSVAKLSFWNELRPGCSGLHLVGSWKLQRMEAAQPLHFRGERTLSVCHHQG